MDKKKAATAISELLEEVKGTEKGLGRPVRRRIVSEIPDAIVLCIIETTCNYCNAQYEYPNPHILGRFGRNCKRIEKWSSLFELLPRERINIQQQAVSCQNCFEGSVLRTPDIEKGR